MHSECRARFTVEYVTELVPVTAMLFEKEPYFLTSSYPTQSSTDIYFLALYCSQNAFGHSVENAVFGVFCMCSWKSNFVIIYLLKKSVWKENKAIMLCCANSRQKVKKKAVVEAVAGSRWKQWLLCILTRVATGGEKIGINYSSISSIVYFSLQGCWIELQKWWSRKGFA